MWLFTVYGFFSAVCTKEDANVMKVRSRDIDHLKTLQSRFPELLGGCAITESENTDYRCRMIVPKSTWNVVCAGLADDVNYGNFKGAVMADQGATDYEQALHRVWSVMYGTQVRKSGPGIYSFQNNRHVADAVDEANAKVDPFGSESSFEQTLFESSGNLAPKRGNRRGGKKKR